VRWEKPAHPLPPERRWPAKKITRPSQVNLIATNKMILDLFDPESVGITETDRFMGSYPAIPFELWGNNQPETVVVVAVVGVVVVTIRHAAVLGVVVPAATTQYAVGAP